MWLVNALFLLLLLTGYGYCLKKPEDFMEDIDKKEHSLSYLYPLSNRILLKTGLWKILSSNYKGTNSIKALYNTSKSEHLYKLFWCKRISQILAVLVLFNLLSIIGYISELNNPTVIDGKYIVRPDYGEGSTKVELKVRVNPIMVKPGEESDHAASQDLTINVKERLYTEVEANKIISKAIVYLEKEVLGDNESAESIHKNLNFISSIPGTSIKVEWYPEDYSLIHSDGTIGDEGIGEEGVTSSVRILLTYYDLQRETTMDFRLMPKQYNEEELFLSELVEALQTNSDLTAAKELFELPATIDEFRLSWESKGENIGITLYFLGIMLSALLWVYGDKELEVQMKKRKQQMLIDYPEIINKFTLLINAGMTIKQAWSKISEDYSGKASHKGFRRRYAYEEMLTTVRELKLGLPENVAYEQYGRRTGLIPYIKFSSLISQNLKKGTKGFTELLMHEAIDAFEERKEIAKRLGEEAGTKLLLPMVVMLLIVFLIIMFPAFSAFSI